MARALFSLDTFNVSLVNLIITMATPHARPVAYSDILLYSFYQSVDEVGDVYIIRYKFIENQDFVFSFVCAFACVVMRMRVCICGVCTCDPYACMVHAYMCESVVFVYLYLLVCSHM